MPLESQPNPPPAPPKKPEGPPTDLAKEPKEETPTKEVANGGFLFTGHEETRRLLKELEKAANNWGRDHGLIAKAVPKPPKKTWQLFGAMMTEDKGGHQAVSFTRVLAVGLLLLAVLMWLGVVGPHQDTGEVPQTLLTTLWGLIGMKAAKDVIAGVRK